MPDMSQTVVRPTVVEDTAIEHAPSLENNRARGAGVLSAVSRDIHLEPAKSKKEHDAYNRHTTASEHHLSTAAA